MNKKFNSSENKSKILFQFLSFLMPLILLSVISTGMCSATEHIVISEVIYDPINSETGGEAVELYNPTNFDIDIGGWTIATENSVLDATIPPNTLIKAHGFFLIADVGWSASKDNPAWPNADYEEAITLANYDAGVALRNGNTTIDAVGWGNVSEILTGFYEAQPMIDVSEGHSIERKPGILNPISGNGIDTNDNSQDFLEREEPEPQNSMSAIEESGIDDGTNILLRVRVSASGIIKSIYLADEDVVTDGIQISPNPGDIKTLVITVNTTRNATVSGRTNISSMQNVSFTGTSKQYFGEIDMNYYDAPGYYLLNITACADVCENQSLEFYYEPMLAMALDSSTIDFGAGTSGSYSQILGDFDFGTQDKATIWNMGNVRMNIRIAGTDFIGKTSLIPISMLRYSFDNDFESGLSGAISYSPVQINLGLRPSYLSTLGFKLFIPENAAEGNYSGSITLMATE